MSENYYFFLSTRLDRLRNDQKRNIGQTYLVMTTIMCKQKFGTGLYMGRKNMLCIVFFKGNLL